LAISAIGSCFLDIGPQHGPQQSIFSVHDGHAEERMTVEEAMEFV
jgi:hypothetical protein